jgi:nitrogen-specific signal transduction histidine kinase
MGLDIVRRLVFNQKGEIEVESKPGRTEFKVAIPLASAAQGAPAMASAPSPVAAPVALT